jgi:hypothetical protein
LTVRDVTLTGESVFDARGPMTLTLQRVRVAGFNTGAGGSDFVDARGRTNLALLAEDCVFDGTVGRGPPRHGTVLSLSSHAKLVRFDRCTFLGCQHVARVWGDATLHFERCTFRDNAHAHVEGATYVGCTFEGNGDDPK